MSRYLVLSLLALSVFATASNDALASTGPILSTVLCNSQIPRGAEHNDTPVFRIDGNKFSLATADSDARDIDEIRWHSNGVVEAIKYGGTGPADFKAIALGKGDPFPVLKNSDCAELSVELAPDQFDVSVKHPALKRALEIPHLTVCADNPHGYTGPCWSKVISTDAKITNKATGQSFKVSSEIKYLKISLSDDEWIEQ